MREGAELGNYDELWGENKKAGFLYKSPPGVQLVLLAIGEAIADAARCQNVIRMFGVAFYFLAQIVNI